MKVKDLIRKTLVFFHLDITKNLRYDRMTLKIMKKVLKKDSNCIDIGCHKGEILDIMLKFSPQGTQYAFEPIPYLYESLKTKYINVSNIFPYALSTKNGETTFQLVKNALGYSGIKKRHYDVENPQIEEIIVEKRKLDDVIDPNNKIDLIKIDVEGGEYDVLKGGINLLKNNKPIIIFECGKGACDYYGYKPDVVYKLISDEIGLNIYTLKEYLNNKTALSKADFENHFYNNSEYYFVADAKD